MSVIYCALCSVSPSGYGPESGLSLCKRDLLLSRVPGENLMLSIITGFLLQRAYGAICANSNLVHCPGEPGELFSHPIPRISTSSISFDEFSFQYDLIIISLCIPFYVKILLHQYLHQSQWVNSSVCDDQIGIFPFCPGQRPRGVLSPHSDASGLSSTNLHLWAKLFLFGFENLVRISFKLQTLRNQFENGGRRRRQRANCEA